jgi:hypothetical protein
LAKVVANLHKICEQSDRFGNKYPTTFQLDETL